MRGLGRTNRVRFGGETRPTEAEGRVESGGSLGLIGAGALVEGALLEAGENGGKIGFVSLVRYFGGGNAERRFWTSGRRLDGCLAADASGDGFFGGGGLRDGAVRSGFEGVTGFEGFDSGCDVGDGRWLGSCG